MPIPSRTGSRYILTFIDDYTRKTWLYFLAAKSQTLDCFKQFRALVEKPTNSKREIVWSDRGGEYTSQSFLTYCSSNGIHKQLTAGYSPHQNGVAKRKNRSLLEGIRSVVTGTKIPKSMWEEIAKTVNYIQNRLPTKALKLKTPEEMFSGIKPNLSHLRVIGCVAYCHIPDSKRQKFDPKAIPTLLLGYDEHTKAYRCYNPSTRKILETFVSTNKTLTLTSPKPQNH
jgi:transposase InsO family protein